MLSDARKETIQRLRVAEGRLHDVIALVEGGAPCGQALSQLCTLKTELRSLKIQLLNGQVNISKNVIQHDPCADRRIAELRRLVNLYLSTTKI